MAILILVFAIPSSSEVHLQSVSLSSGLYLNHWTGDGGGNGFGWTTRDNSVSRPQTFFSGGLGVGISLAKYTSLKADMTFYHSRLEEITEEGFTTPTPGVSKTGLGDFNLGLAQKWGRVDLETQFAIPGPYEPKSGDPYAGMSVWRWEVGAGLGWQRYYGWASSEFVVAETHRSLVSTGDYWLKAGASAKYSVMSLLTAKPGMDINFSSIRWGNAMRPLKVVSYEPKLALTLAKHWKRSVSLTMGGTLYSAKFGQSSLGQNSLNVGAPRKLFFGLGASLYL